MYMKFQIEQKKTREASIERDHARDVVDKILEPDRKMSSGQN